MSNPDYPNSQFPPPIGARPANMQVNGASASRPLFFIAREISRDWQNVYFGAAPYLAAMRDLNSINDKYYEDGARSIVAYFLGNANTWRGETARRVKAELKALLKTKG